MQDIFRCKYRAAKQKLVELHKQYHDQEQIDLHFHSAAGKTLALAFGTSFLIQLIIIYSLLQKKKSSLRKMRLYINSSLTAFVCGHFL